MDRTEILDSVKRALERSTGDPAAREEVDRSIRDILAPLDRTEKLDILNNVRNELNEQADDRKRRLNTLLLAVTGQIDIGDKDAFLKRLRFMEKARAVFRFTPPAELRRAIAGMGEILIFNPVIPKGLLAQRK